MFLRTDTTSSFELKFKIQIVEENRTEISVSSLRTCISIRESNWSWKMKRWCPIKWKLQWKPQMLQKLLELSRHLFGSPSGLSSNVGVFLAPTYPYHTIHIPLVHLFTGVCLHTLTMLKIVAKQVPNLTHSPQLNRYFQINDSQALLLQTWLKHWDAKLTYDNPTKL